jgi:hypothetical protein
MSTTSLPVRPRQTGRLFKVRRGTTVTWCADRLSGAPTPASVVNPSHLRRTKDEIDANMFHNYDVTNSTAYCTCRHGAGIRNPAGDWNKWVRHASSTIYKRDGTPSVDRSAVILTEVLPYLPMPLTWSYLFADVLYDPLDHKCSMSTMKPRKS